jgi:hypothetical protein
VRAERRALTGRLRRRTPSSQDQASEGVREGVNRSEVGFGI